MFSFSFVHTKIYIYKSLLLYSSKINTKIITKTELAPQCVLQDNLLISVLRKQLLHQSVCRWTTLAEPARDVRVSVQCAVLAALAVPATERKLMAESVAAAEGTTKTTHPAKHKLVEHDADGEADDLVQEVVVAYHLRRHVRGRTALAVHPVPIVFIRQNLVNTHLVSLEQMSKTKFASDQTAVLVHEDVVGLEVAVDNVVVVHDTRCKALQAR